MAEPDGVMNGTLWPSDWQTGWVSWIDADTTGAPLSGSRSISMTVQRAYSSSRHTTIHNTTIVIPNADGRPSGPRAVLNGDGVPCIELPISRDPDVQPFPIGWKAKESWSGFEQLFEVGVEHTLDSPLYLTGDVLAVPPDPTVTVVEVYRVPLEASGPQSAVDVGAGVGDWILYEDTGRVVQITGL